MDKYKVIVNGHPIKMSKRDSEDCFGEKCCSVDLVAQKTMRIVIKRRIFSCILCFLVNVTALVALLSKESGWEPIRNVMRFVVENPNETNGEITIRIYNGALNKNSIMVSDSLIWHEQS